MIEIHKVRIDGKTMTLKFMEQFRFQNFIDSFIDWVKHEGLDLDSKQVSERYQVHCRIPLATMNELVLRKCKREASAMHSRDDIKDMARRLTMGAESPVVWQQQGGELCIDTCRGLSDILAALKQELLDSDSFSLSHNNNYLLKEILEAYQSRCQQAPMVYV